MPTPADANPGGPLRGYLLMAGVVLVWGVNWPIMKIGLNSMPPLFFASARVLLGALTLFALLAVLGRLRLPPRSDLPIVLSVAAFQVAGALALMNAGLQFVPAGRSAILVYTTPLWVAPLAHVFLGERLTRARAAGLGLGIFGLLVLFSPAVARIEGPNQWLGHGLLIGAAISFAVAVIHIRKHRWRATTLDLMPWQLLLGGGALALASWGFEGGRSVAWSSETAWVLAFNGPIASAFCFWAYVSAAKVLPANSTALASLGVPLTGLASATLILGEPLGLGTVIGMALVVAGILLVTATDIRAKNRAPG